MNRKKLQVAVILPVQLQHFAIFLFKKVDVDVSGKSISSLKCSSVKTFLVFLTSKLVDFLVEVRRKTLERISSPIAVKPYFNLSLSYDTTGLNKLLKYSVSKINI